MAELETETNHEILESSLNTEAVLAGVDEAYEVVRECLDAAEQALNEGNKEVYDQNIQEANSAWNLLTTGLNQKLPSGTEVREDVLNYCGDLSLMIDGDIASMDERWGEAERNDVLAEKEIWYPLDPETVRKNYAEAKSRVESLRGVKKLLTLGSSSDKVLQELTVAENIYHKARAEYLGVNVDNFLQEKIKFTEAELKTFTV